MLWNKGLIKAKGETGESGAGSSSLQTVLYKINNICHAILDNNHKKSFYCTCIYHVRDDLISSSKRGTCNH